MSDFLLLGGIALCLLSVIFAVIQLLRLEPPRTAIIMLILGIVAMFAGASLAPEPFTLQEIPAAWARMTGGTAS